MAAATCDNFCSFFETEVTSRFIRFSILTCVRSLGEDGEVFCVCVVCARDAPQSNKRKAAIALANFTRHGPSEQQLAAHVTKGRPNRLDGCQVFLDDFA